MQLADILEFYRDLTEAGGFELETAGVLKKGRKLWALARTGQSACLKGRDRVSEFTPGVWSQFAAVMSRVAVAAIVKNKAGGKRELSQAIPVTQLSAKGSKDGKSMFLSLRGLAEGEELNSIALSAEGAPDLEAQVEERLYAVVTRYVYDAFDLMRDRPLRVHPLLVLHPDGGIALPEALWPIKLQRKIPTVMGTAGSESYAYCAARPATLRASSRRPGDTRLRS